MAGIDTQKKLLSLIRDFTSERSRGEQRVVGLKKRIESLQSEVESANSEVEKAKRIKEVAEEELNGYEVELSLNDATIQSLEARIKHLQDEVSTVGNEVDALKNKEGLLRDQFISQMEELNKEIREFQKTVESSLGSDESSGITANVKASEDGYGDDSESIKNMLSDVNTQLAKEEEEYLAEQKIQEQLQKELDEYEKKMSLMEAITDKTNSVQILANPKETKKRSLNNDDNKFFQGRERWKRKKRIHKNQLNPLFRVMNHLRETPQLAEVATQIDGALAKLLCKGDLENV